MFVCLNNEHYHSLSQHERWGWVLDSHSERLRLNGAWSYCLIPPEMWDAVRRGRGWTVRGTELGNYRLSSWEPDSGGWELWTCFINARETQELPYECWVKPFLKSKMLQMMPQKEWRGEVTASPDCWEDGTGQRQKGSWRRQQATNLGARLTPILEP